MKVKRSKKVNGILGNVRTLITSLLIAIYLILFVTLNSIVLTFLFGEMSLFVQMVIALIVYLLISIIYYYHFVLKDKYYIRPIKNSELNSLKGKRLIHYTNYIDSNNFERYNKTGSIKLSGNNSARANYRMRFNDKKSSFVWFHVEDSDVFGEPELNSFRQSHFSETKPREYKIIINSNEIADKSLYINPDNGNILVRESSLTVPAKVYKKFEWYNKQINFIWILESSVGDLLFLFPAGLHQFIGNIMDKIKGLK